MEGNRLNLLFRAAARVIVKRTLFRRGSPGGQNLRASGVEAHPPRAHSSSDLRDRWPERLQISLLGTHLMSTINIALLSMMGDAWCSLLGYNGDEFNWKVSQILALMSLRRDPFNVPSFRILIVCFASRPGIPQMGIGEPNHHAAGEIMLGVFSCGAIRMRMTLTTALSNRSSALAGPELVADFGVE
jgi:hypothetical protein